MGVPKLHPSLIDPAYLTARADVEAMLRGIELARDLASATVLEDWRGPEVLPGEGVTSREQLEDFVRRAAGPYHHAAGTCRMGIDAEAVVDSRYASGASNGCASPTRP